MTKSNVPNKKRIMIAVAGSSKAPVGSRAYQAALEIGKALVDNGYRVLTGGGGGVMQAAHKGAHMSEKYKEGDTVAVLPSGNINDANYYADIVVATGLSHFRNGIIGNCKAMVAVAGGAGTLNEITVAWQMQRMVIGCDWAGGWAAELCDRQLDACPRYDGEFEDKIWRASSVQDIIQLLDEKMSLYNKVMDKLRYNRRIIIEEGEPIGEDEV